MAANTAILECKRCGGPAKHAPGSQCVDTYNTYCGTPIAYRTSDVSGLTRCTGCLPWGPQMVCEYYWSRTWNCCEADWVGDWVVSAVGCVDARILWGDAVKQVPYFTGWNAYYYYQHVYIPGTPPVDYDLGSACSIVVSGYSYEPTCNADAYGSDGYYPYCENTACPDTPSWTPDQPATPYDATRCPTLPTACMAVYGHGFGLTVNCQLTDEVYGPSAALPPQQSSLKVDALTTPYARTDHVQHNTEDRPERCQCIWGWLGDEDDTNRVISIQIYCPKDCSGQALTGSGYLSYTFSYYIDFPTIAFVQYCRVRILVGPLQTWTDGAGASARNLTLMGLVFDGQTPVPDLTPDGDQWKYYFQGLVITNSLTSETCGVVQDLPVQCDATGAGCPGSDDAWCQDAANRTLFMPIAYGGSLTISACAAPPC